MGGGPFRWECFVHGRSGLSSSDTSLFFPAPEQQHQCRSCRRAALTCRLYLGDELGAGSSLMTAAGETMRRRNRRTDYTAHA